ncbi:general secretion pathway protein K [Rhizobiales bacterium GAS188]|nr:general secretion pathway protein K [Rhizobiales bacterium GAS188]
MRAAAPAGNRLQSSDGMQDPPRQDPPRETAESGFVIVAVLWIVGALATLASIYALYTSNTALASRVNDDRLQAEASISAALELTAYQATSPDLASRPPQGAFALRLGRSDVAVEFRSEAARIDLNAAPKELLAGLFTTLGARTSDADFYADRIIAWRTPNQEADQEEEASAYRVAGLAYKPRRGPFQSTRELWLVMGLPASLVEHALPFVTVFNGRQEIDVADAAPTVVAALPGMTPERLQGVLDQRGAADPRNGQAAAKPVGAVGQAAAPESRKTIRVTLRINFDNGRQVRAEVVILIPEGGEEPYRILSWHDDFDGPA